jgi:hypothetical protein
MRRGALFLTLMLAASAAPALADLLNVELTISYVAPDNFPAHSHFAGTANFYIDVNGPQPTNSPGLIFLDVFDRNIAVLEDPSLVEPCITDAPAGWIPVCAEPLEDSLYSHFQTRLICRRYNPTLPRSSRLAP